MTTPLAQTLTGCPTCYRWCIKAATPEACPIAGRKNYPPKRKSRKPLPPRPKQPAGAPTR
jgi:hypothetical protein